MKAKESKLKQKILFEMHLFMIYSLFLALFFTSLTMYKRLILGEYSISYFHYGSGLIQALILSKIILIGESLQLGEKLSDKPLIIPTLYKTVLFSILVLIFTIIEHFVIGYFHGIGFTSLYQELLTKGLDEILAKVLVVFFVFILFFAFLETSWALGDGKLINLFFTRKTKDDSELSTK